MSTGSVAPVAVTTMSAGARAGRSSDHGTARPSSCRASASAVARVRLAIVIWLDALRAQVHAGELGHLPGAEDEHVEAGKLAEDLSRQFDRRVADRNGALAEAGFAAHALADAEGGVEQAMRHRAGEVQLARGRVRRFDLTEDLRLADDQRVEARRDAEEVRGPRRRRGDSTRCSASATSPLRDSRRRTAAAHRRRRPIRRRRRSRRGCRSRARPPRWLDAARARGPAAPCRVRAVRSRRIRAALRAPYDGSGQQREAASSLEVVALRQEVADRYQVQQHDDEASADNQAARRPLQPIARRAKSANE